MASDKCETSDEIQIPIEELAKKQLLPIFTTDCCIYKVPETLRKENEGAYTPSLISIGPMHHKNPKLDEEMKKQKFLYFSYFFARNDVTVDVLNEFTNYLKVHENEIRNCYSEKFTDLDKNQFVHMILLDAVFIMELFLRKLEKIQDDYMFSKSWLNNGVLRDLLLAENQLPFGVLEELYKPLKNKHKDDFLGLARKYFKIYDPYKKRSAEDLDHLLQQSWRNPKHFTDLIRYFYIPQELTFDEGKPSTVPRATKLKGAGIHFKPVSDKCLLAVTLEKEQFLNRFPCLSCLPYPDSVKARLLFPKLIVDDTTEFVLRNLIAFEQCHCHYGEHRYISSYASLLNMLIGEKDDADILVESGVIVNKLGNEDELTTLINKLSKNVVISSPGYGIVSQNLEGHYNNRWNKAVADIRLVYFSTVWKGTGTIVGLILLFTTVFNFIRSNIEYFS